LDVLQKEKVAADIPGGIMNLFKDRGRPLDWQDYYNRKHREANRGRRTRVEHQLHTPPDSDEDDIDFGVFENGMDELLEQHPLDILNIDLAHDQRIERIAALQRQLQELTPASRLDFFSDSDSDDDRGEGESGDDFPDPRTFDSGSDVD